MLSWSEIEVSANFIYSKVPNHGIDEDILYDQMCYVRKYVTDSKISEWEENDVAVDQRWVEMFKHFKNEHVPYNESKKIVEYALCLPGTNAVTERIFSLINNFWTSDKTQMTIETVKTIIIVKHNLSGTCEDFLSTISSNDDVLKKVHSSQKYC